MLKKILKIIFKLQYQLLKIVTGCDLKDIFETIVTSYNFKENCENIFKTTVHDCGFKDIFETIITNCGFMVIRILKPQTPTMVLYTPKKKIINPHG